MQRRAFITSTLAVSGIAVTDNACALDSKWWPYGTSVRIQPKFSATELDTSGYFKKMPASTSSSSPAQRPAERHSTHKSKLLLPRAYDVTGEKFDIDPWLIYGVALQESKMKFGQRTLPYPWTLCVAGSAKRFGSYDATLKALRHYVEEKGIRNVDCGAMQVNWRWHKDKLTSFEKALDPYPNLFVGTTILREHYNKHGSWMRAAALYHTGSDADAATIARGRRYSTDVFNRLGRMGLDVNALLASKGWRRYDT